MAPDDPGAHGPTRVERFLAHLDRLSDGREPTFHPIGTDAPGRPPITSIVYQDLPEPGDLTAFTYRLSLVDHPNWRGGRKPELMISVRSRDIGWGLAIGYLVDGLRGRCPFGYGNVLTFGEVSPESAMTSFVLFAPTVLAPDDHLDIDVGDARICLSCCYPIHASEAEFVGTAGLERFWELAWDERDVTRPPALPAPG